MGCGLGGRALTPPAAADNVEVLSAAARMSWCDSFQPGFENELRRPGTADAGRPFRYMNKLYPLLLDHRLPLVVRYPVAAGIMLVCAVMQTALQMLTGHPGYFLLLPGVFLSGLIFDRGSGILAAAIALGVAAYASYGAMLSPEYLSQFGLFAITAAGTAVVAEFLRSEMKRVMQADKAKALLLQEMAHRTKNNLAVLSSMIRLQARAGGPSRRSGAAGYGAPHPGHRRSLRSSFREGKRTARQYAILPE